MTTRLTLLALVFAASCGVREEGVTVNVSMRAVRSSQITSLTLAVEHLQLSPCQVAHWWDALNPLSTAWAHGDEAHDSPWMLAASTTLELMNDEAQSLGVLHPPPATLCSLQITFAGEPTLALETNSGRQESTKRVTIRVPIDSITLDAETMVLDLPLVLDVADPAANGDESLDAMLRSLTRPR